MKINQVTNTRKYRLDKGKKFTVVPLTTYYTLKQRCNDVSIFAYKDYGARGIKCLWKSGEKKPGTSQDDCKGKCVWKSMGVKGWHRCKNCKTEELIISLQKEK